MKLTSKEQDFLLAVTKRSLYNMGGKLPNDLHDDNFSWFQRKDFPQFDKYEAAGLMSSLDKKGLIQEEDRNDWAMTHLGIDVAQKYWDKKNV